MHELVGATSALEQMASTRIFEKRNSVERKNALKPRHDPLDIYLTYPLD